VAKLILAAQVCALVGLAWTLQACCCGVVPPKPGPPGSISGQILRPPAAIPGGLSVYAVDALNWGANYVTTRVAATESSYRLAVPPGEYFVVARMDSDPLSAGGHTFNVECSSLNVPCGGNANNYSTTFVRVESKQDVTGIDIGDWGTDRVQGVIWNVDVEGGSPLALDLQVSPSPKSLASRPLPDVPPPDTSGLFTSRIGYVSFQVPSGWAEVMPPASIQYPSEVYFSNEQVNTPLALDSQGVWLTIWSLGTGCPFPDWRYATARSTVKMQGGTNHFFYEDPRPRDGPQPFTGYSVRGGAFVFGDTCDEFVFTGVTRDALENNLPAFFGLVERATFARPT
jgi:hypothetical protein